MHTLDQFARSVCRPRKVKAPCQRRIYSAVTGVHIFIVLVFFLTGCQTSWAPLSFLVPEKTILTEVNPNTIGLYNSAPELFEFRTKKSHINLSLKPDVIP
jgi:hypothetical protein